MVRIKRNNEKENERKKIKGTKTIMKKNERKKKREKD